MEIFLIQWDYSSFKTLKLQCAIRTDLTIYEELLWKFWSYRWQYR